MKKLRGILLIAIGMLLFIFVSLAIVKEGKYHSVRDLVRDHESGLFVGVCILGILNIVALTYACLLFRGHLIRQHKHLVDLHKRIACITANNKLVIMEYDVESQTFILWNESSKKPSIHFSLDLYWKNIHTDDLPIAHNFIDHMNARHTNTYSFEYRAIFPGDSGFSWLLNEVFPFEMDKKGIPVSYLGVYWKNNERHEMLDKLKDYKDKVLFMAYASGIVFADFDTKTNVLSCLCNEAPFKDYSMTLDEYISFVHPDDREKGEYLVKMMKEHTLEHFHTEYRFTHPWEDDYVWYSVDIVATAYDAKHQITGYTWLNRDNNAWHKAMDEMLELQAKVRLNTLQRSFLHNINHEIRSPLNAIVGFSNILCEEQDQEERLKYKDLIEENTQKLLRVVDNVLMLSKIETGDVYFNLEDVNITDILRKLLDHLRPTVHPGVQLICNLDKSLRSVLDVNHLKNITSVLLNNAIKFTDKGSITLEYEARDGGLYMSVTDTGIGIAIEKQPRIFERFEKLDSFKEGTGAGLPICRAIITKAKGEMGVESQPGKGSKFWYWIPRKTYLA